LLILEWATTRKTRQEKNSHEGTAEQGDTNHEHPARDGTETPDEVAQGNVQVVLGKPAIDGMQSTLVGGDIMIHLLPVDLVDLIGSDGSRVEIEDVERSGRLYLADLGSLGNLIVEDGGSAGGPDGAQDGGRLAVHETEVRRDGIRSEQESGFLME
jgi:hypothetical protein